MRILKDGWLPAYLDWTDEHESPLAFHQWTGLSTLAICLERNIWIKHPYFTIYPNIYVVLIAGSALCKKSSAIRLGTEFIQGLENYPMNVGQKMSPERMLTKLWKREFHDVENNKTVRESQGYIAADELATLFGKDSYKNGFMANVTALYDCPSEFIYTTRKDQDMALRNVCVNILGASTLEWLKLCIPPDIVGGGFLGRFLLVHGDTPRVQDFFQVLNEKKIAEHDQLHKELLHDLEHIRQTLRGEYSVTKEGKQWFNEWRDEFNQNPPAGLLPEYVGRRHTTLLKIALLLAASSYDEPIITRDVLQGANNTLLVTEGFMPDLIAVIGQSETGADIQRVLDHITSHYEIGRTELARKVSHHLNKDQLDAVIKTLHDGGQIRSKVKGNKLIYSITD